MSFYNLEFGNQLITCEKVFSKKFYLEENLSNYKGYLWG